MGYFMRLSRGIPGISLIVQKLRETAYQICTVTADFHAAVPFAVFFIRLKPFFKTQPALYSFGIYPCQENTHSDNAVSNPGH